MRNLLLLLMCTGILLACGSKSKLPSGVLPAEQMEAVMWDMLRTDQFLTDYVFLKDSSLNKDEVTIGYYKRIFRNHGITRDDFKKSFNYYETHPGLLKAVMDSIAKRPELKPEELYKPKVADSVMQRQNDSIAKQIDTAKVPQKPRLLNKQ